MLKYSEYSLKISFSNKVLLLFLTQNIGNYDAQRFIFKGFILEHVKFYRFFCQRRHLLGHDPKMAIKLKRISF